MNLIIGFFHPQRGRILLDGADLRELDLQAWRRQLAVVSQTVLLFSGTLRDNICYGMPAPDEARLAEVVRAAQLERVVADLPQGLETPIGENGVRLSGGQRQRIAIARALMRDPRVIILDEATSALDVIVEREVQAAIDALIAGRTTFIVAHRLSTIRRADRVIVMKGGEAVEQDAPEALLAAGGEFARLKALQ
jgi:ATP-binding cassette subfamily B protein